MSKNCTNDGCSCTPNMSIKCSVTSDDGMFTLETVACLGACGLAPVMTVDGEVHAKMSPTSALELLEKIRKEEAAQ